MVSPRVGATIATGTGRLTKSACFWAFLSKPLRESLRHAASCCSDSGAGCQDMAAEASFGSGRIFV